MTINYGEVNRSVSSERSVQEDAQYVQEAQREKP